MLIPSSKRNNLSQFNNNCLLHVKFTTQSAYLQGRLNFLYHDFQKVLIDNAK
ncbi:hypothetical protein HMPREF0494_0970 [Limosilactobacillus antri DSM 16041]|uniref:Uncharacterized protein n=1 Tax=Limosilactobacillus antri DSM 16041 TaxID=525309 RepID=C8P6M6_9LACO|nr:hypothetical protein HMPREF0494_0970 [Limosilactobacillus antri DSM 16041]